MADAFKTAESIRFVNDLPSSKSNVSSFGSRRLLYEQAMNGLRVSQELTPDLASAVSAVTDRLALDEDTLESYVYQSNELQALCVRISLDRALLMFSSALVRLLSTTEFQFVVGHEIGHFLLNHHDQEMRSDGLGLFSQSPAQEISADRLGLVGCDDLETAIKALMKIGTGLDERHLRFDVGAFIAQIRGVDVPQMAADEVSTHPPFIIRCRALLSFSLSAAFRPSTSRTSAISLERVDQLVAKDLARTVDLPIHQRAEEAKEDYLLWHLAELLLGSNWSAGCAAQAKQLLDQSDQRFPRPKGTTFNKLKAVVSDMSLSAANDFIQAKKVESKVQLDKLYGSRSAGIINAIIAQCRSVTEGHEI